MNRQQRRASSRCPPPPHEGLICRAEAVVILRKSRSTVFRYEEEGLLVAVYVGKDGTRWFDLKTVMQLAARLALEERAGQVISSRQKVVTPVPPPPVEEDGDYHPERRVRRPPRAERAEPVGQPPPLAPPPPSAPKSEEKALLPSAKGAIAIRTTTLVDPNWFNEDLDPKNGKGGSVLPPTAPQQRSRPKSEEKPLPPSVQGAIGIRPTTAIDPKAFDDDFQSSTGKAGSK